MNKTFDSAELVGGDIRKHLTVGRGAMEKYNQMMAAKAAARDETPAERRKRQKEELIQEREEELEALGDKVAWHAKNIWGWRADYGPFVLNGDERRAGAVAAAEGSSQRPMSESWSGQYGGKRKRRTRRHKKYNKKSHKKRGKSYKKGGKSRRRR